MTFESPIERLDAIVAAHGSRLAVSAAGRSLTFAEVGEQSERVASAILSSRHDPAVPVALALRELPDLVIAMYGTWKAGTFFTVIDPSYPSGRISAITGHSGTDLIITDERAGAVRRDGGLEQIEIASARLHPRPATPIERLPMHERTIANIAYTSGSSGRPKGVIRPMHSMMRMLTMRLPSELALHSEDRVGLAMSLGFVAGFSAVSHALLNGASVHHIQPRGTSLRAVADWIDREELTSLQTTPSLFRHLSLSIDQNRVFSGVRALRLGGDLVTVRDVERFRRHFTDRCVLRLGLASSEAASHAYYVITHDTPIEGDLVSVGYPDEGVDLWIEDDDGNRLGHGEVGEIVISSDRVTPGYWNEPDGSFEADPERPGCRIHRTGDLGRIDRSGLVYFVGRKDDQLKIRGHRVEPIEVESALARVSEADEVAVVGQRSGTADMRLIAWIGAGGREIDVEALREKLRARLPEYMVPERIEVLETLPRNPNGKIDRRLLRDLKLPARPTAVPADPIERRLLEIWIQVLERDGIRVTDRFFEIGGNSILAVRAVAEIEKEFGVFEDPGRLIAASTILSQADVVRGELAKSKSSTSGKSWIRRLFGGTSQ